MFAGPPRVYKLRGTDGKRYGAYRMVLQTGVVGERYGLRGTPNWKTPPILEGVTDTRKVGRRTYELVEDGDRLRLSGLAHSQGRLLDLQHAAAHVERQADDDHRARSVRGLR